MFVSFAAAGYTGRGAEINFGSRTVFAEYTGAAAADAKAAAGGEGGVDVRPDDVSKPAGGTPPAASVEATFSAIGVFPSSFWPGC
jgi:hypothetical protein